MSEKEIRELLEAILDNQEPIHKLAEIELKRRGITVTAFKRHSTEPSDIDEEEPATFTYPEPAEDEAGCEEQKDSKGNPKPMKRTDCKERYGLGICECSKGDPNKLTIRCKAYKNKWSDSGAVE